MLLDVQNMNKKPKKAKIWKNSHALGIMKSHLKHLLNTENQYVTMSSTQKAVHIRKFMLVNGLRLDIVDNKHLKAFIRNTGTWKGLSKECSIGERVRRYIKVKYQFENNKMYIIMDKWNDSNSDSYFGVQEKWELNVIHVIAYSINRNLK